MGNRKRRSELGRDQFPDVCSIFHALLSFQSKGWVLSGALLLFKMTGFSGSFGLFRLSGTGTHPHGWNGLAGAYMEDG